MQSFQSKYNLGDFRGLPLATSRESEFKTEDYLSGKQDSLIKISRFDNHYEKLKELESELLMKSLIYQPNSEILNALRYKIKGLKKSLNRPQEILFEYNNILREYFKKESILSNLETQLYKLDLEKSKQLNPWQLISDVTLEDDPINNKKNIVFIFLTFGFFLASFIKLIEAQFSKIVYEAKDFTELLKCNFLLKIPRFGDKSWEESINVFEDIAKSSIEKGKLFIFILSEKDNYKFEKTLSFIVNKFDSDNFKVTNQILDIEKFSDIIFIACPGEISQEKLGIIQAKLKIQDCNYLGWTYFESND